MTVRVYQASDAGAPVFTSAPGSLLNVLSKCLVEGYGSKAGAGWTKPFVNAANTIAAFKQGGGNNRLLRVDDTAAATTSQRYTRVRGYETMSDIDTGNGPFPTLSQYGGSAAAIPGAPWCTHYTNSATDPMFWVVIADETFFYINFVNAPGQEANTGYRETYWFGDLVKYGANDNYATVLMARASLSGNTSESAPFNTVGAGTADPWTFYAPRSYTGLGGAVPLGKHHDAYKSGNTVWGQGALSYPHGPDGALLLSPVWVHEMTALRGKLPGCWAPLQEAFNNYDTFDGQGEFAGKKFMIIRHGVGRMALEISDTWR